MPLTPTGSAFRDEAEHFERLAPSLWNPAGNALVAAAEVVLGDKVLDVACGTGSATIPAAQSAGPDGFVDALTGSEPMLDAARSKAQTLNLETVRLHRADPTGWEAAEPYDAVLAPYAVFLLPDLDAGAARLVSMLRGGGRLAVSTWADGALVPFGARLGEAAAAEGADPGAALALADRIGRLNTPERLQAWLEGLGLEQVQVQPLPTTVQLPAEMVWSLVLGSGLRTLLPEDPHAVDRVRTRLFAELGDEVSVNADTLLAVGRRPA